MVYRMIAYPNDLLLDALNDGSPQLLIQSKHSTYLLLHLPLTTLLQPRHLPQHHQPQLSIPLLILLLDLGQNVLSLGNISEHLHEEVIMQQLVVEVGILDFGR